MVDAHAKEDDGYGDGFSPSRRDEPSAAPTAKTSVGEGDDGHETSLPSVGKAKQRNSLNPLAMRGALAGLADLDDSEGEDGKQPQHKPKAPSPPQATNPKASGGPEHRPLVGGFAAAAYEAARVDYYKKRGKEVRGHQAPNPRPDNYPRYP
ncbi:hypothetical protein ACHAXT_010233 [Thalassiosira profunda]